MAKKAKIPLKKLTEPDEFITVFDRVKTFLVENWRMATVAAVILALVVVGAILYMRMLERREDQASFLLTQAVAKLKEADSLGGDAATKAYDESLKKLDALLGAYRSTKSGHLANFYRGKCLSRLRKYPEAIQAYEKFLSASKKNPLFQALSLQNLGFIYENQKDYARAIRSYEESSQMEGQFLKGESTLSLARVYEEMGNVQEALKKYKEFLAAFPGSTESNQVERKIALLESKPQKNPESKQDTGMERKDNPTPLPPTTGNK